ncbi:hypothetical protein V8B97DRAFT_2073137 [Scleroderma yunnanense]
MNNQMIHIDANERVPTLDPGEIGLIEALSFNQSPCTTTVKHLPHVLQLQVPTSIQNITLSFELKSQGPVTIEINLTTTLPELTFIADSSDTMIINCTTTGSSTSRVKLKPTDTSMVSCQFIAHFISNICCLWVQPLPPLAPMVITEPESQAAMPTVVKNTIPIYAPPTQVPCPTFRCSFTPDSFARSETFESISTQLITIRLIMGQENNKRCQRSEASFPTPPPKCYRKYKILLPAHPPTSPTMPINSPPPITCILHHDGTHGCCGALVSAHVATAHKRADLHEIMKTSQSPLHFAGHRVIPLAQKDVGPISQTFPFPICTPLPPLSPDVAFLDPPCFSPSPVEQEMLDHGTLTGKDINILTFGSVLPNLGPNFHSLEVLLSAVDYFQEYNTRTSVGGQPLTPFIAHHLPLDPEQHALKHQLQQIMEEVHAQESSALDEGPPPDQGDLCYTDGFWYHSDANNIPHETELQDDSPQSRDKDNPDPFFIDEEVQSDNLDLADITPHITVIHAVISWLHLQFHLPHIACNVLLAVFTLLLLFLNPNITVLFTTLQSSNRLLGVNKPIHTLPVCPTCHDVYPPATSPLCHDTCTSYQTLCGNACAVKTLQIALILKIPGMEKPCKPGTYTDIFDSEICHTKLRGPDGKLFFSNNVNEWHGPNGKLQIGVNLGVDWYNIGQQI